MDGRIFDDLARSLAERRSRRSVLKGLAAAATGALLDVVRREDAGARACRDAGETCTGDAQCCTGICGPKDSRGRRQCACPANLLECRRDCIDPATDEKNCGGCGISCPRGSTCESGVCSCVPETCASLGAGCGTFDDGCGRTIQCTSCPSGQVCDGTACKTTNGGSCASGSDCASGVCAAGICCNQTCDGACQSCGSGTCTGISGTPCGGDGVCAGTSQDGTCIFPGSETVCGAATCSGSTQQTGYACNGAGACVESTADCGLYFCVDGSCPDTCDNDADCLGSAHCAGGICQGDLPDGEACTGDDQCISGHCIAGFCQTLLVNGEPCAEDVQCVSGICANGICCDRACTGGCETCESGICRTLDAGEAPRDCAGAGLCQGACDGVSPECTYPGVETVCGAGECQPNNTAVTYACNGEGACLPITVDCGLYRCADGHCPTTCADSGDCIDAASCSEGVCVGGAGIGDPCTSDAMCAVGHCHNGVCSDVCLPRDSACTSTSQCCQDGFTICDYDSDGNGIVCTSDVGGSCPATASLLNSTGCAMQPMGPPFNLDTYDQVFCAPIGAAGEGTCGGAGALCLHDPGCLSGSCCNTRCCPVGYRCNGAVCLPLDGACTGPDDCASGLCCDGQCVERTDDHCATCSDICAANETCANAECRKDIGETCATGADCATGFCYDGVCCDECGGLCGKPRPDTMSCRTSEGGGFYMCCGGECIFPEGDVDSEHCGCGNEICPIGDICDDTSHRCGCDVPAVCNPDGITVTADLCNTLGVAAYCAVDVEDEKFCVWGDFSTGPTIACGVTCDSNDDCPQVEHCRGDDCTTTWRCIRGDNTCCRGGLGQPVNTCVPVAPGGRGTTPAP
jgi:hypothetical protein